MALTTTKFTLAANTWTDISGGADTVLIQMKGVNPVAIHVGTAAPAADAPYLVLSDEETRDMPLYGVSGSSVYAKGLFTGAFIVVVKG